MDEVLRELLRKAMESGDLIALQRLVSELMRRGMSGEILKVIRDFLKAHPGQAGGIRELAKSLPPKIARKANKTAARILEGKMGPIIRSAWEYSRRTLSSVGRAVAKTAYRLVGGVVRLGAAVVSRGLAFLGPVGFAVAAAVLVIAIGVALYLLLRNTGTYFVDGRYIGTVVIEHLDPCEEFGWGRLNRPPGRSATPAYLTVSPQLTVLKIEYDEGNTVAKDWFETDDGTLKLTSSGRMIGGVRHRTGYYFEVFFTYDSASKQYVGTGTWVIQDQCEGQVPGYPVTITLRLR